QFSAVVRHHVAQELHLAGAQVDLDLAHVRAVGETEPATLEIAFSRKAGLDILRWRDAGEPGEPCRDLAQARRAVGAGAAPPPPPRGGRARAPPPPPPPRAGAPPPAPSISAATLIAFSFTRVAAMCTDEPPRTAMRLPMVPMPRGKRAVSAETTLTSSI